MTLKLLNTTVFRLSLVYALLFSAISVGAMSFIYWAAANQIIQQTDTRLRLESQVLVSRYRTGSVDTLRETVKLRNEDGDRAGKRFFVYALTDYPFSNQIEPEYITDNGRQAFVTLSYRQVLDLIKINWRVSQDDHARVLITQLGSGWQLLVAADLGEQQALLAQMQRSMIGSTLLIVVVALMGGMLIGYYVLRRIDGVRKTATDIIDGDLSQRMKVTLRNDEFDRLSLVLNSMLQRIEQLMQAMREVSDNLAHDLRNPLNRLRNRMEAGRFLNPASQDFQQLQQDALQDVDDLIKTFNALLSIAQAESGVHRNDWVGIDLSQLVQDLGELYEVVAEEQGIQLCYQATPQLSVYGNRQLLAQALTNLLDNAVKYTPQGGTIQLSASRLDAQQLVIVISDTGPGIPSTHYHRVFERFVRLDNARSTPGNGLGLSLVKAVVDLHGGQIRLEDQQPSGLRVVLSFAAYPTHGSKA